MWPKEDPGLATSFAILLGPTAPPSQGSNISCWNAPGGWGQEGVWGEECSLSQPRSRPFFWVLPSPRADLPSLTLWRGEWGGRAEAWRGSGALGSEDFHWCPLKIRREESSRPLSPAICSAPLPPLQQPSPCSHTQLLSFAPEKCGCRSSGSFSPRSWEAKCL